MNGLNIYSYYKGTKNPKHYIKILQAGDKNLAIIYSSEYFIQQFLNYKKLRQTKKKGKLDRNEILRGSVKYVDL